MLPPLTEVVTLGFGTGSLCLLTLALPPSSGLTRGIIQRTPHPLIRTWQCDLGKSEFTHLQKLPWLSCPLSSSLLCQSGP